MLNSPFAECRTLAEHYKALIRLENVCSPAELVQIWQQAASLPDAVRSKLGVMIAVMRRSDAGVRDFRRTNLSENVDFYRGASGGTKDLLVCFCGNANRLMLPLPVFLQFVPDEDFDVLVVRDPTQSLYLRGIPGLAFGWDSSMHEVSRMYDRAAYRDVRCYGTSAGGAAALYAAFALNAVMGVSIGGRHPTQLAGKANFPAGCTGEELGFPPGVGAGGAGPVLLAAYGRECEADRQGGIALARRMPQVREMAVDGCEIHNLNLWLLERNLLKRFLEETILVRSNR